MYPTNLGTPSQQNQNHGHQQQSNNSHHQVHPSQIAGTSPGDNSSSSFLTSMGLANVMSIGHNTSSSSTASSPVHQQQQHLTISPSPASSSSATGFLVDGSQQQHQSHHQSSQNQQQHHGQQLGHHSGGFQSHHHHHHGLVSPSSMSLGAYPTSSAIGHHHHHHSGISNAVAGPHHHHHPSIAGLSGLPSLHQQAHHHVGSLSVSSLQQAEKRKQRRIRTTFTSSQLKVKRTYHQVRIVMIIDYFKSFRNWKEHFRRRTTPTSTPVKRLPFGLISLKPESRSVSIR